ncbi:PAS domain S-box-containing protein/diguanylate cyclase (GGDEF) domain-containing protein [Amphritea atlantica]|uniref:diguanylate cyclase n=2 Tax=Amphritea atlantica TaxID=355243 RepID=A0A1H9FTE3_9GAMM|nr:PAS domain S-box-containing protein/diguanylate cyclase (GGDEF) domain-containing protein [Amphritea atlantica]
MPVIFILCLIVYSEIISWALDYPSGCGPNQMHLNINQADLISICPDPVIAINRRGVISVFNTSAENLLGYSADQVIGDMNIRQIYPSDAEARKIMRLMMDESFCGPGRVEGYETYVLNSSREKVPIRLSAAMLMKQGEYRGSVGFFHDMTRQKALETTLLKQSITDDLSGLYNQRHFYVQVASEMMRVKRYGGELSLVCIDLDGFKQVNDKLGHLEGDQIVRLIGRVLRDGLRDSDQAFRYGGDEFMLLLPNTAQADACQLADRVRQLFNLECNYSPSSHHNQAVTVSMSLGVASCSGAEPVDFFVQRADMAMYSAKQAGGDCVRQFSTGNS